MPNLYDLPLVSIIMPMYNAEKSIKLAIYSMLNQTYQNFELIVLDDGSIDESVKIVESIKDQRIKLIKNSDNKGISDRLNQGIAVSNGEFIARMDSDDASFPHRIACQYEFMMQNPLCDLVGCSYVLFDDNLKLLGERRMPAEHNQICRRPWSGIYVAHPTWFARVNVLKDFQYDARFNRAEDQELLLRCSSTTIFANITETLFAYRSTGKPLGKKMKSRRAFFGAAMMNFVKNKQFIPQIILLVSQLAKIIVDIIESKFDLKITTGYLKPISRQTEENWKNILETCLK